MTLPVTLLTDYGYDDEFAGACRAVIARLAPDVRVIDLTHGIPPGDVRRGALALEAAVGRAGSAVHLAVVDPGVGTDRRGIALAAGGSFFVGPDNGLLARAAERLGGVTEAVDVSHTELRLEPVAPTFHGRDLFAPVAAHLAAGRPLAAAGESLDPATLAVLELPEPRREGGTLVAHVLYTDRFGNIILDALAPAQLTDVRETQPEAEELVPRWSLGERLAVTGPNGGAAAVRGLTFADGAGGLVVYDDSSGRLGVALDGGSAAEALGAGRDDELRIGRS